MRAAKVAAQLKELLGISLGLNIYPSLPTSWRLTGSWRQTALARLVDRLEFPERALRAGIQMAIVYFLAFGALPWFAASLSEDLFPAWRPILVLQLYGALWSGWATASTRAANRSIMDIIKRDLLPVLTPKVLDKVSSELASRYLEGWAKWRLYLTSWGIGAAAAAVSAWLLCLDLTPHYQPASYELIWWWVGWTLLYTTAAKVVIGSRCFKLFADALAEQESGLFWPNPAASTAIVSMALVAKRMLVFWLGIAVSIALILPFGLDLSGLSDPNSLVSALSGTRIPGFVAAHLVGTALFSIGAGSLIFLRTEGKLRRAAQVASAATMQRIEAEVGELKSWTASPNEELKRLAELKSLHEHVASGASYQMIALSGLSLIIPFVPVLTLLLNKWLNSP